MAHSPALLVLEDGRTFNGASFGADGESFGEMVFNTSMSGYQEILTDPSYAGQIVCMTYPLIGNYGVNEEDVESRRPWVEGFVVREASRGAEHGFEHRRGQLACVRVLPAGMVRRDHDRSRTLHPGH